VKKIFPVYQNKDEQFAVEEIQNVLFYRIILNMGIFT